MPTTTNHNTTTSAKAPPSTPPTTQRDRATLLRLLDVSEDEGWNGPIATHLLEYLRESMIRPLAVDVGLRGALASQAESSAWQATWPALTKPALRSAQSPWGVLWQIARRAILGEVVASRFATNERRAWELNLAARNAEVHVPISLDALIESGWQLIDDAPPSTGDRALAGVLAAASTALASAGWDAHTATRIVQAMAHLDDAASDPRCIALGWQSLAAQIDQSPWQARRPTVALRGIPDRPGLFARLADTSGNPSPKTWTTPVTSPHPMRFVSV